MRNKYICIILARGGSKRLPFKNVKLFNGKPLIAHTIEYAKKFDFIDNIIVSTDDKKIAEISKKAGSEIIHRPKKYSTDTISAAESLKYTVKQLINNNFFFDKIVLLQAVNPIRPKNLLTEVTRFYEENNLKTLFTVTGLSRKLGEIKNNKFYPFNYKIGQRSQDMKKLFFENGLVYIVDKESALNGIIIDKNSFPYEVNDISAQIDIDTEDDFKFAEKIFKAYK